MSRLGCQFGDMKLLTEFADNQRKQNCWIIAFIKEGIGMYTIGSSLRCLNQGDIMILPPTSSYGFSSSSLGDEYNENITAYVMTFSESWLNDLISIFPELSATVLRVKEINNPMVVKGPKWMKISNLFDDYISADQVTKPRRILDILFQISTPEDVYPIVIINPEEELNTEKKIEMINRYLDCNLCNKITLEDLASYVKMNRTYFCMFFKNHFKEGFSDYINRRRIEKACYMLKSTNKDIPSIVSECGFKTVPYFTRVFTKVKGITPGKYRAGSVVEKFV